MKRSILVLFWVFMSATMFAQGGIDVAGIVLDEQGQELIGVSVQIKGKQGVGVVTDFDGRFKMTGVPAGSTLVFSYIGYETREIKYTATKLKEKIALKEAVNEFDEVVVVGRDTQRKVSVVGAITNVDPAGIQAPAVSVSNMLGGRVPGIIAVTRSGEPGNNFSEFWIRGMSTFGASSSALVLIDGIEGNINDLDPADIESFSILKDASATAIYGSRAANGVVVIETVLPKAGKLQLSYNGSANFEIADLSDYNLMNAEEKLELEYQTGLYTNTLSPTTDLKLKEQYQARLRDVLDGVDTYWLSKPLRTGVGQKYNLRLEGGSEEFRWLIIILPVR